MKTTNKIWLGLLALVIIIDIIIVATIGAKSTLSYFVWSHRHWMVIPFVCGEAMGHFWNKRFNPIYNLIGNFKYLALGIITSIVLLLTIFTDININANIPFFSGYIIGFFFWGQVKIK